MWYSLTVKIIVMISIDKEYNEELHSDLPSSLSENSYSFSMLESIKGCSEEFLIVLRQ